MNAEELQTKLEAERLALQAKADADESRLFIATFILHAMLTGPKDRYLGPRESITEAAIYADALIAELKK